MITIMVWSLNKDRLQQNSYLWITPSWSCSNLSPRKYLFITFLFQFELEFQFIEDVHKSISSCKLYSSNFCFNFVFVTGVVHIFRFHFQFWILYFVFCWSPAYFQPNSSSGQFQQLDCLLQYQLYLVMMIYDGGDFDEYDDDIGDKYDDVSFDSCLKINWALNDISRIFIHNERLLTIE